MNSLTTQLQHAHLQEPSRAIIYARCSTKNQTVYGDSLNTQMAICERYCNENNLTIIDIIQEVIPGHKFQNQKCKEILDSDCTDLVVADPSRLSRNVSEANIFMNQCSEKKINIHSARDNIVSNTLQNKKRIISGVYDAWIESQTISKRIKSAIDLRQRLGSHIGKCPYGFKIKNSIHSIHGIKIRKLIKSPDEFNIIQLILLMYYGCSNMTSFYKLLYKLNPNANRLVDIDNNEFYNILYGWITVRDIMHFLNDNNILKNRIKWTCVNIYIIIKQNKEKVAIIYK